MATKLVWSGILVGVLGWSLAMGARADDGDGGERAVYQTANMHDFPGGTVPLGGATLLRHRNSVDARIAAIGLDQNAAYTVWWVVFNNPDACVGGCGADDLGRPETDASVFYAAGFVTGLDGIANFTAHLDAGRLPEGIDVRRGDGLRRANGFGAEIHMIVRSHKTPMPGQVGEQIGRFGGGCGTPSICQDQQAVAFPPVP